MLYSLERKQGGDLRTPAAMGDGVADNLLAAAAGEDGAWYPSGSAMAFDTVCWSSCEKREAVFLTFSNIAFDKLPLVWTRHRGMLQTVQDNQLEVKPYQQQSPDVA